MNKVARHSLDTDLVEEGLERQRSNLREELEDAPAYVLAVPSLVETSLSYAGYLAVANPGSDELCRALRIGTRAAAGVFTLATGKGEVELGLEEVTAKLPATGPNDWTHVGRWRTGWWLAHIVRDRDAKDRLADTPLSVLRQSSTKGDECQYLFAEALQGFAKHSPDWSNKLQLAVDATDPTRYALIDEAYVLNILVPEMQLLFRLATRETAPFHEALEFALVRHRH